MSLREAWEIFDSKNYKSRVERRTNNHATKEEQEEIKKIIENNVMRMTKLMKLGSTNVLLHLRKIVDGDDDAAINNEFNQSMFKKNSRSFPNPVP